VKNLLGRLETHHEGVLQATSEAFQSLLEAEKKDRAVLQASIKALQSLLEAEKKYREELQKRAGAQESVNLTMETSFSDDAAAVVAFARTSKEKEHSDRKRKKSKHNEQSLEESLAFIVQGIAIVNPIWRVTFFEFSSPEDAVRFWQAVCKSTLWSNYSLKQMQSCQGNPARKVLMSLGYTDAPWDCRRTKTPLTLASCRGSLADAASDDAAEWMKKMQWHWNMSQALRNCYWFCNRSMQKNTSKLLEYSFAELLQPEPAQANNMSICAEQNPFSFVNEENIKELHKDTFCFEKDIVGRAGVLQQIVFLSETLHQFVQTGAIVNLKYHVSRPDSGELRVALENFCSPAMLPSADAPAAATSGSLYVAAPPPPAES
jgi:hypothetical protein